MIQAYLYGFCYFAEQHSLTGWQVVTIILSCLFVVVVCIMIMFVWYFKCRKLPVVKASGVKEPLVTQGVDTLGDLIDEFSQYTGSGSGKFFLTLSGISWMLAS